MEFFRNVDMGFDRNAAVVTIRLLNNNDQSSLSSFESELRRLPFVENVAKSFTLPSGVERNRNSRNIGKPEANDVQDYQSYEYSAIDENFLDLYGIRLIAGRNLTSADSSKNILVNETLMKNLGYSNPQEIVGAQLKGGGGDVVHVVGVINDYYGNSLKERVDNIALDANAGRYRQVSVRLDLAADQNMTEVLTKLEQTWKSIYPEHEFQFRFLDDNIAMFYEQELKYSRLFQVFSAMFVLIGCLGLYGLITFIANRKGKEIAVRKTLGASVVNIIVMFSREYVALITMSFALAVPIAWYGVNEWLMNFENHIDVQWWLFAAPGVIVLAIALTVVCMKSFNAAIANPVDKLRNE
jgi:ABC-type antimicrobial peptide transport system permease subunit